MVAAVPVQGWRVHHERAQATSRATGSWAGVQTGVTGVMLLLGTGSLYSLPPPSLFATLRDHTSLHVLTPPPSIAVEIRAAAKAMTVTPWDREREGGRREWTLKDSADGTKW